MKVVGILSAHDESPHWLATAVAGFGRVCDAIVYAEGAYALYPGARPRSHPAQTEAVVQAAEAADVELLVHRPKDVYFNNEVEKRNKTLQLAASLDPDWVMVFDADYHLMRCNPDLVRWELENTDALVATYTLLDAYDMLNPERGEAALKMVSEVDLSTEWTYRTRDIYRWTPDLRYGPAHFTIRGTYDGETQWIRGPELVLAGVDPVPALDLLANLVCVHRTQDRAKVRKDAAQQYYRTRDDAGVENLDDNWAVALNEAEERV